MREEINGYVSALKNVRINFGRVNKARKVKVRKMLENQVRRKVRWYEKCDILEKMAHS